MTFNVADCRQAFTRSVKNWFGIDEMVRYSFEHPLSMREGLFVRGCVDFTLSELRVLDKDDLNGYPLYRFEVSLNKEQMAGELAAVILDDVGFTATDFEEGLVIVTKLLQANGVIVA